MANKHMTPPEWTAAGVAAGSVITGAWGWLTAWWTKRAPRKTTKQASAEVAEVVSRAFERLVDDLQAQSKEDRNVIHDLQLKVRALEDRANISEETTRQLSIEHGRCTRDMTKMVKGFDECCELIRSLGRAAPPRPRLETDI